MDLERILKSIELGEQDRVQRDLNTYNQENAQCFFFNVEERERRKRLGQALIQFLAQDLQPCCLLSCLETIRILSRDRLALGPFSSEEGVRTLARLAGIQSADREVARGGGEDVTVSRTEAVKALCNVVYNSQGAQEQACRLRLLSGLAGRLKLSAESRSPPAGQFYDLRLIFLLTALRPELRCQLAREERGVSLLTDVLERALCVRWGDSYEVLTDRLVPPLSQEDSQLAIEILKILFNITCNIHKASVDEMIRSSGPVREQNPPEHRGCQSRSVSAGLHPATDPAKGRDMEEQGTNPGGGCSLPPPGGHAAPLPAGELRGGGAEGGAARPHGERAVSAAPVLPGRAAGGQGGPGLGRVHGHQHGLRGGAAGLHGEAAGPGREAEGEADPRAEPADRELPGAQRDAPLPAQPGPPPSQRRPQSSRSGLDAPEQAGPPDDPCGHRRQALCCRAAVCALQRERVALRQVHRLRQRRGPPGGAGAARGQPGRRRRGGAVLRGLGLGHRGVPGGTLPDQPRDRQGGGAAAGSSGGAERGGEGGGGQETGQHAEPTGQGSDNRAGGGDGGWEAGAPWWPQKELHPRHPEGGARGGGRRIGERL